MSKVWFITGASRGLGRALAEEAAAAGHTVVATARDVASIADLPNRLRLDVTDAKGVADAVEHVVAEHGRIDVLVNNAGHGFVGVLEEVNDDDLRALLETNLVGAWGLTREVLPHMRRVGRGHVVQMSSVGGVVGNPGHAAYATTKFALEGMSEALAGEVAPFGIGVTIVEPGPFRTDFAGSSLGAATANAAYAETPGGRLRSGLRGQDGRQPNDPARAAAAIIAAVEADDPPLRLPLGPEAVDRIRTKLQEQLAALDDWEELAVETRFAR